MKRFAFFIHPLDMADVIRSEPKAANKRPALVEKMLEWTPPHVASHIRGLKDRHGEDVEGWFIIIPLLPHQFINLPKEKVYEKILQGAEIARQRGAQILGLGGFTSIIGSAGISIAAMIPDIPVTSGNSYTIATAMEATIKASEKLGIDLSRATAAVVGASGSIGSICAELLAQHVSTMNLVARNQKKLQRIADRIGQNTGKTPAVYSDIAMGIDSADIIVTATSSSGNIIMPSHIKTGALICDVSMPHDVSRDVAHQRPDVLVIEGGLAEIPSGTVLDYYFGYPPHIALACMSETMILTLEGIFEVYSIGRSLQIDKVKEISMLAGKNGFKLAGFRSFDRLVTDEMIENVKRAAEKKRNEDVSSASV